LRFERQETSENTKAIAASLVLTPGLALVGLTCADEAAIGATAQYDRYVYSAKPEVNLVNAEELPAYPFCTEFFNR
jgi:hypothetical protein